MSTYDSQLLFAESGSLKSPRCWTSKVWAAALLSTQLTSSQPLVTTLLSIIQHTPLFTACFWLKSPCLYLCAQSCPTLCDPMTVARQAPLSVGFSRQEYQTGLPLPPPFPDPRIKPASAVSALAGRSAEPSGKPTLLKIYCWFTNAELMVYSTITHAPWSSSDMETSSVRHP